MCRLGCGCFVVLFFAALKSLLFSFYYCAQITAHPGNGWLKGEWCCPSPVMRNEGSCDQERRRIDAQKRGLLAPAGKCFPELPPVLFLHKTGTLLGHHHVTQGQAREHAQVFSGHQPMASCTVTPGLSSLQSKNGTAE